MRVDALTRMLIACNNWVCTTGYGGPELRQRITDRTDTLYHTIDRSSVSGSLYMYRQIKEVTSTALYEAKDEKCSRLFHKFDGNLPEHPAPIKNVAAMHIVCELADIADDNTESIIRHSFRNDADDESSNGAARAVERTCQQRRLRND